MYSMYNTLVRGPRCLYRIPNSKYTGRCNLGCNISKGCLRGCNKTKRCQIHTGNWNQSHALNTILVFQWMEVDLRKCARACLRSISELCRQQSWRSQRIFMTERARFQRAATLLSPAWVTHFSASHMHRAFAALSSSHTVSGQRP